MKHRIVDVCRDPDCLGGHSGHGLGGCEVCGCAEGEIPTDCPGVTVPADQRALIYAGQLDYLSGAWVSADYAANPAIAKALKHAEA